MIDDYIVVDYVLHSVICAINKYRYTLEAPFIVAIYVSTVSA